MSSTGIRYPALPFVAAGLQVGAGLAARSSGALGHRVVLLSHAVVAAWLIINVMRQVGWRRVGTGIALAGWLLNLAVMLPNGGMPVSMTAVASVKGADHGVDPTDGHLSKHVPLSDDTVLAPLADVHPLRPLGLVYSVGDVLLLAGLVVVLAAAWTPASLTNHRRRTAAAASSSSSSSDETSDTSVPGSIPSRYSTSATP